MSRRSLEPNEGQKGQLKPQSNVFWNCSTPAGFVMVASEPTTNSMSLRACGALRDIAWQSATMRNTAQALLRSKRVPGKGGHNIRKRYNSVVARSSSGDGAWKNSNTRPTSDGGAEPSFTIAARQASQVRSRRVVPEGPPRLANGASANNCA